MRLFRIVTCTSLLTLIALPGFGQVRDIDITSVISPDTIVDLPVCTTLTDVCHGESRFAIESAGLLVDLPEPDHTRAIEMEVVLYSVESGLEVVETITGKDYPGAAKYVSADVQARLPDRQSPSRWNDPKPRDVGGHQGIPEPVDR